MLKELLEPFQKDFSHSRRNHMVSKWNEMKWKNETETEMKTWKTRNIWNLKRKTPWNETQWKYAKIMLRFESQPLNANRNRWTTFKNLDHAVEQYAR